jgi:hypothetical protein
LAFTEEKFFMFNPLNWLLATRTSQSPINSLFFDKGQFYGDFKPVFDRQFFPCGPESPFINIALSQYELTRNNDIGVYLCSGKCDVLYSHANCGWPNQTSKCQVCGQDIGCKPNRGHTICRDEEGARRVMSPVLKDSGGSFYIGSLSKQPFFFEAQRCYIEAEINRMKQKAVVQTGGKEISLLGYQVENQGRVGTLTYYIFRQILHSLLYCLCSLKVIAPQETPSLFKAKDLDEAKSLLLAKQSDDIAYIKNALNLDSKIYGWIFGIHSYFFELSRNFQHHYARYLREL